MFGISANDEENTDEDLEVENEIISLRSTVSLNLIKYPVRSSLCRHFSETMDLRELLEQVRNGGKWECTVCHKSCQPSQLHVDAFAYFCLQSGATASVEIKKGQIITSGG